MTIQQKAFEAALNAEPEQVTELLKELTWKDLHALIDAANLLSDAADLELGERS